MSGLAADRVVALARNLAGYLKAAGPRVVEGVTIGLIVAAILLTKDWYVEHRERQDEIAFIRDVIVSSRSRIAEAHAGVVATPVRVQGVLAYSTRHRSRDQAQAEEWHKLVAKLSDVLAYRTSRLTYDEKRELRDRFPGISVDGNLLLGDGLDVVISSGIRMHYKSIFSQAEKMEWLDLPPASDELMEKLIPEGRES
ncbi:MAG: hypothetical protein OXU81_08370 [Gammaproteobacteria bacterium]|nr:hypothetical protein [Gammaproteobacteria bacterium]